MGHAEGVAKGGRREGGPNFKRVFISRPKRRDHVLDNEIFNCASTFVSPDVICL